MTAISNSLPIAPLHLMQGSYEKAIEYQPYPKISIRLPKEHSFCIMPIQSIVMIKSDSNYSTIYFENHKQLLTSKTLKHWQSIFNQNKFLRCHASYLVNRDFVKSISSKNHCLILHNGHQIKVSRTKWKEIKLTIEISPIE